MRKPARMLPRMGAAQRAPSLKGYATPARVESGRVAATPRFFDADVVALEDGADRGIEIGAGADVVAGSGHLVALGGGQVALDLNHVVDRGSARLIFLLLRAQGLFFQNAALHGGLIAHVRLRESDRRILHIDANLVHLFL